MTFILETMSHPEYLPPARALQRPSSEERERIAQVLCLHFASDNIGMESLEQRLAVTYATASHEELQSVVADLPMLDREKLDPGAAPVMAPTQVVPPRGLVMAVMGGVARKGNWLIPRHTKVFAFMGGAELDLRDAKFAPGVTELEITVLMGGVEVTVPLGVRVEVVGAAIMGGFESSAGDPTALDVNQPVLRVSGIAIMGGVEVKVKRPAKRTLKRFDQAVETARQLSSDLSRRRP